jgi:hypothetical protein
MVSSAQGNRLLKTGNFLIDYQFVTQGSDSLRRSHCHCSFTGIIRLLTGCDITALAPFFLLKFFFCLKYEVNICGC